MFGSGFRSRNRALKKRILIDVAAEAENLGIAYHVAISPNLWFSLIERTPGASQPEQHLALDDLLNALANEICSSMVYETFGSKESYTYFTVPMPFYWLKEIQIKAHVLFWNEMPESITLLLPEETIDSAASARKRPLPTFPLFRLVTQVRSLSSFIRFTDQVNLIAIRELTSVLLDHPLHHEIHTHCERLRITREQYPDDLDAYRVLILQSMHSIITELLASASTDKQQVTLTTLKAHVETLLSPMANLTYLLRTMSGWAARLPEPPQHAAIKFRPYDPLIQLFADLQGKLNDGRIQLPKATLDRVDKHLEHMATFAPKAYQDDVDNFRLDFLLIANEAQGNQKLPTHAPTKTILQ